MIAQIEHIQNWPQAFAVVGVAAAIAVIAWAFYKTIRES